MRVHHLVVLKVLLLYVITMLTEANKIGITAVSDQSTSIPCHAFTSAKRILGTVTLIRWIHSSFHKPIYTLDLRSVNVTISADPSIIYRGRHFPSPETEGRFYLDTSLDPLELRIDPVISEDAGMFECLIDFRNQRSLSSSLSLEVDVPPKEAIVRNSYGQKVEGVTGPYQIGQSVKLTCESLGGTPTPVASWSSNIEDQNRYTINGPVLLISSLERKDQWSHHTCTVQNTNMTASKSVTVITELFLPPMELHLHSNIHKPFISGQNVEISCQSFGSYPRAHVMWKKNGVSLKAEERITNNGNVTTSFIEFTAKPSDDGTEVECMAFNPEIKNHIFRRSLQIKVHYKPEVQIIIMSNQSQLSEGHNLILLCHINASPEAYRIVWMFENELLSNRTSLSINGKTLYIAHLKKGHAGKYECFAENDRGEENDSVTITVKHRPLCREADISHSYEIERNTVNVTCHLESYPSDVTFYWTLRNSSSNHSWSSGHVPHTSCITKVWS